MLSLINEIPKDLYEVTIFMVRANGDFLEFIPSWVTQGELPLNKELVDELLAGGAKASIIKNVKKLRFLKAANIIIKKKVLKDPIPEMSTKFEEIQSLEKKYDVAIAFHMHMPFIVKYVADKVVADIKIAWIHNDFLTSKFHPGILKEYLDKYDKFFAVSKQLMHEYVGIFPEFKDKTEIFYNIISQETIKKMSGDRINDFDQNQINILSIGRLDRQKGYDLAIKVCRKLLDKGYDFKWYIIGEGNEREALEKAINKLKLENNFILLGMRTNPYPYLEKCDIYVQPSRHEGYCLTLAEARCLYKPIVTTDFAGAKEQIINNVNGIITLFDVDQLFNSIERLISNKDLMRKFSVELKKQGFKIDEEENKLINYIKE
ncbi:glycosyltransferase [Paenibacillus ihuae]|uniref:glycosyltransferase n=1 Tax=Paenibacillus ihuae TaxID=1232431 RepID=UPI0006D5B33D|nr:glycosyltransferase [Paenibacillus ihuae]